MGDLIPKYLRFSVMTLKNINYFSILLANTSFSPIFSASKLLTNMIKKDRKTIFLIINIICLKVSSVILSHILGSQGFLVVSGPNSDKHWCTLHRSYSIVYSHQYKVYITHKFCLSSDSPKLKYIYNPG